MGDETFAEPGDEPLTFRVSEADAGQRLDSFLAARVAGASRTAIKRAAEGGDVLVGGRPVKPSHKLRAGDEIEAEMPAPPATDLLPEDIPLDIVHEDADLVVVNKPAGMVVHPAAGVSGGTLANALAHRFRGPGAGGRGPGEIVASPFEPVEPPAQDTRPAPGTRSPEPALRPGIVHRLDRDTSGLVVVAKTAAAHEDLSEQFRAREVFKSYVALVYGRLAADAGSVDQPIGRDPRHRARMTVVRGARAALSLYRVRRRYERFTLLDVEIKTGRTHQIRVHLAWLKHPVVGDKVYGGGRENTLPDARVRAALSALGRQFLHAARLGFRHPRTGERMRFEAPLPVELAKFLGAIEPE